MKITDLIQQAEKSLGREFTAMEQYQIQQRVAATPNGTEDEAVEAIVEYVLGV